MLTRSLFVVFLSLYAQLGAAQFQLGVFAGRSGSMLVEEPVSYVYVPFGKRNFTYGVAGIQDLGGQWRLKGSLQWSRWGVVEEETQGRSGGLLGFDREYLQLSTQIYWSPKALEWLHLGIGPYVGRMRKAILHIEYDRAPPPPAEPMDVTDDFAKRDFGALASLGLTYYGFELNLGYWEGITQLTALNDHGSSWGRNRALQVSLGYYVTFKR